MKIRIVAPAVEPRILRAVREGYARFARSNTQISVTGIEESDDPGFMGPHYEYLAAKMVQKAQEAEIEATDAAVFDCMGDPGLEEARRPILQGTHGPMTAVLEH